MLLSIGWNVTNKLNVGQILAISIFALLFITAVIILIHIFIYKSVIKYTNKSFDNLKIIADNPVNFKVRRIQGIAYYLKNKNFDRAADVWIVNYDKDISKRYFELIDKVEQIYNTKKKWNIISLFYVFKSIKKTYELTNLLRTDLKTIYSEMETYFKYERELRDIRISIVEKYGEVKASLNDLTNEEIFKGNVKLVKKTNNYITKLFDKSWTELFQGNIIEFMSEILKINDELELILLTIDIHYAIEQIMVNDIALFLNNIEEYVNKMEKEKGYDSKAINSIRVEIRKFKTEYSSLKNEIYAELESFRYKNIWIKFEDLISKFNWFFKKMLFKHDLYNFISEEYLDIKRKIDDIEPTIIKVENLLEYNKETYKNSDRLEQFLSKKIDLNMTKKEIERYWNDNNSIFSSIYNNKIYLTDRETKHVFETIQNMLQKTLSLYSNLYMYTQNLKSDTVKKNDVAVYFSQVMAEVSKLEVIIENHKNLNEVNSKMVNINNLQIRLDNLQKSEYYRYERPTNEQFEKIKTELDEILEEAKKYKIIIETVIQYEKIAENLIVYIEANLINSELYFENIDKIYESFEEQNFKQTISLCVGIINENKG